MAIHLICHPGWTIFIFCKSQRISLNHALVIASKSLASLSREGLLHTAISKNGSVHRPH